MKTESLPKSFRKGLKLWVVASLAFVVGCLALTPIAYNLMSMLIHQSMCGNDLVKQEISPSGQHKAVIFLRNCGATTSYETNVSILDSNEALSNNDEGNTFSILDGIWPIDVKWEDDSTLQVVYELSNSRIYLQENTYQGIKVKYEAGELK